jgi:hypothetical protein
MLSPVDNKIEPLDAEPPERSEILPEVAAEDPDERESFPEAWPLPDVKLNSPLVPTELSTENNETEPEVTSPAPPDMDNAPPTPCKALPAEMTTAPPTELLEIVLPEEIVIEPPSPPPLSPTDSETERPEPVVDSPDDIDIKSAEA